MKNNKLTLKESELVSLIEKIAKDTKGEKIEEQARDLKRQISKTSKAQRKADKDYFKNMSNQILNGDLIIDEIIDVDYKKYPKLNELSKMTLMKQTIDTATALWMINTLYTIGETCEERQSNFNLNKLDDFLLLPLNEVFRGMKTMADNIPGGVLKRPVNKFLKKAEKLVNMLYDHKLAQKHFKDAGLNDPMDQWNKLTRYKSEISELATDALMDIVVVTCPVEGEVGPETKKKKWWQKKKKSFDF
jgi:hypothetical protein